MNTYEFRRNGEERKRGDRRITGFQPVRPTGILPVGCCAARHSFSAGWKPAGRTGWKPVFQSPLQKVTA